MEITKDQITIKDLTEGYVNNDEEGVLGYGGKLDIRPPYQREFVYNDKQRNLVIHSILNNYPLSVMYWNTKDDGKFEVLDGQQRTLSICEYVANKFNFDGLYFSNQPDDIQQAILNYELDIYKCKGEPSERLAWFEVINVAGETLTPQELLNATFAGPWTTDAKKKFSKTGCPAYAIGNELMSGSPIRQDYLETALKWISKGDIKGYMGKHQDKANADELWNYFESVIDWVNDIFVSGKSDMRKEMKGVAWGELYNEFKDKKLDSKKIQAEVTKLMKDDDVTKLSGIYPYVLTREEKHLSIRKFPDRDKRKAYEKQGGKCDMCGKKFDIKEMEADHDKPWIKGGTTTSDNCIVLCKRCNIKKSAN